MVFYLRMVVQSVRRRFTRWRITFAAIAFSTAIIVMLQALLAGVSEAMVRNAVSIQAGHVQASWPASRQQNDRLIDACQAIGGVRLALMRSRNIGVLTDGKGCYGLATVYGVDPQRERQQTLIAQKMVAGDYLGQPGDIIVGRELADMLNVGVGQTVTFRPSVSEARGYRVGGIFRTGLGEMDRLMAFTHRQDGGDSQEISLFLEHPDQAAATAERIKGLLPPEANTREWREIMPNLVQILEMDAAAATAVTFLVLTILAFGISNTIYVSVSQRTREFGILKAMGLTPRGVALQVLAETGLLVAGGALTGAALGTVGLGVCAWCGGVDLSIWTSLSPLFAGSSTVHPRMSLASLLLPVVVTIAFGLAASLLPACRAGRVPVIESLRCL